MSKEPTPKSPKVTVAVCLLRGNKVLLGGRCRCIDDSYFSFPNGHLEFGESFEECAAREMKEETRLDIDKLKFLTISNNVFKRVADSIAIRNHFPMHREGLPQKRTCKFEAEKVRWWGWYGWEELAKLLFLPLEIMIKDNFNPFLNCQ